MSLLGYIALPHLVSLMQKHRTYDSSNEKSASYMKTYTIIFVALRVGVLLLGESLLYSGPQISMAAANKLTSMFVVDLVVGLLLLLIRPDYLVKRIMQRFLFSRNTYTQSEANDLHQNPQFNTPHKHSLLATVFLLSASLVSVAPLGSLLAPLALFVLYWGAKLNLARRESLDRSETESSVLMATLQRCLEWALVLKPVVNLVFFGMSHGQVAIQ